jgi:hypothetical protein
MIFERQQVPMRFPRLRRKLPRRVVCRLGLPRRKADAVDRRIRIADRAQRLLQRRMAPTVKRLADQQKIARRYPTGCLRSRSTENPKLSRIAAPLSPNPTL